MTDKNNRIADISEDIKQTLLKEFAENTSCFKYELPEEQEVGYFIDEEAEYDPPRQLSQKIKPRCKAGVFFMS